MALIWIVIAVGILIAIILIVKIAKTPSHEAVSLALYCKVCGIKTNGLKCISCEKKVR